MCMISSWPCLHYYSKIGEKGKNEENPSGVSKLFITTLGVTGGKRNEGKKDPLQTDRQTDSRAGMLELRIF